ncbi:MAG: hypothetical protein WEB00_10515 [Dehalococcoidia bacterium]
MELLIQDSSRPPDVAYDELVTRLKPFPVEHFLRVCNRFCAWLDDRPVSEAKIPLRANRKYRTPRDTHVYLTPWAIMFLAKASILHSSDMRHGTLTDEDFLGLVSMHVNLKDIYSEERQRREPDPKKAYAQLIRIAWEQFDYQGTLSRMIPRTLLLLVEGNRGAADRPMDLEKEFENATGLTLDTFVKIGFAYYSAFLAYPAVDRLTPTLGIFEGQISQNQCELFLAHSAADYDEFRTLSGARVHDSLYAKTEFNALLERPLVVRGKQLLCPVPRLVLHRMTEGVIHDLMNLSAGTKRNAFR